MPAARMPEQLAESLLLLSPPVAKPLTTAGQPTRAAAETGASSISSCSATGSSAGSSSSISAGAAATGTTEVELKQELRLLLKQILERPSASASASASSAGAVGMDEDGTENSPLASAANPAPPASQDPSTDPAMAFCLSGAAVGSTPAGQSGMVKRVFPHQLWALVDGEDKSPGGCVKWSRDGATAVVLDCDRMIADVLPAYAIGSTSIASFFRQLNYYR
jgi:hypothetical protein